MTFRPFLAASAMCLLAGTAAAQEREWTLDASDQDAYLIFGVPESDDVGISLWCPIRQGEVNVFVPETGEALPGGKTVAVTIEAGEAKASFKGKTDVNLDAGVASAEARVPASDPIFAAMQKTDRFKVTIGKDNRNELIVPLYGADLAGLLALCRKG